MITTNIDVSDGLVNGGTGMLEHITISDEEEKVPKTLWLRFENSNVGNYCEVNTCNI